jgi:hypothetical protein
MSAEADRPLAALAMLPGVEAQLLTADSRGELESMVELVAATAVDLNALPPETLARVEIIVGGWGCNLLDDALLARMPKLRLLAYAAGSVKHTVTPATWEHGVLVSSAAAANAVPVAEFTFAVIVMIAKDVFRVRDRHRDTRGREPAGGEQHRGELAGAVVEFVGGAVAARPLAVVVGVGPGHAIDRLDHREGVCGGRCDDGALFGRSEDHEPPRLEVRPGRRPGGRLEAAAQDVIVDGLVGEATDRPCRRHRLPQVGGAAGVGLVRFGHGLSSPWACRDSRSSMTRCERSISNSLPLARNSASSPMSSSRWRSVSPMRS